MRHIRKLVWFYAPLVLAMVALSLESGCTKKSENASQGNESAQNSSNPMNDKGIGPISSVKLEAINPQMAKEGKAIFQAKCSACHKIETRYVGPALKGVTQRRRPEWIMNMILNPAEMTHKDPIAKELLATHFTQMTFQNVNQEEVRKILEFFRQNDAQSK